MSKPFRCDRILILQGNDGGGGGAAVFKGVGLRVKIVWGWKEMRMRGPGCSVRVRSQLGKKRCGDVSG